MDDKTFEQLSSAIAHEIKNPVTVIKANIDYLMLIDTKKENIKNYTVILKELDKINTIITDFIELNKTDKYIKNEYFNLTQLIKEVYLEFKSSYTNINFDFTINNPDIYIEGNYSQICVVFFNLYKNAVEAVDNNGTINTIISVKDNIIIEIKDNGKGIEKSNLEKIGTAFFTTKAQGSGLGITVCKNILKRHKGNLNIKNNTSSGCTVTVTFQK